MANAEETLRQMNEQSQSYANRIEILKTIVDIADSADRKVDIMRETARCDSKAGIRGFFKK